VPAPRGAGDPTPNGASGGGATLIVYNTAGSGEQVSVQLAASGWLAPGDASAPKGYPFSGSDPDGPGSSVPVKARQLESRAGKTRWGYPLAEQSQGRIAVRLQLGSGTTWCADAPAKASADPSSNARVDNFTAQPKPAPPAPCPPLP